MIARGVLVMKKIFLTACFMIVSGIFALGAFARGKTEKVPYDYSAGNRSASF